MIEISHQTFIVSFIGISLLAFIANGVYGYRELRDGSWHVYNPRGNKYCMRRRTPDGKWECRDMTDAEWDDYESWQAW
jgi:hypothetical protein